MKKQKLKIKTKKDIKIIIWLLALIALVGIYNTHNFLTPVEASAPYARQNNTFPIAEDKELAPLNMFLSKTKSLDKNTQIEMWEVINCESRWNPEAKNGVSTARGLAQFIFKTWDNYCEGNVYDPEANLDCFLKLYPKHKHWWECSKILGYI